MAKKRKLVMMATTLLGLVVLTYGALTAEAPNFAINLSSNLVGQAQIPRQEEPVVVMEMLGSARLSYAGSTTGRSHNIELGVARIDGTVVYPGEEFSYIKALGAVSKADGFSEEKAFRNGEVTKGLGGGLCQVSTILFQTALNTGLPITDRTNHTYSVSFYQTGLDATFANPAPDLKFINDTGSAIIIKGKTENQIATFEIYGIPDGRKSTLSEAKVYNRIPAPPTKYVYDPLIPLGEEKCENYAQSGYTAKIIYNVLYSNGENKVQEFISRYLPLARTCYTSALEYAPEPTTPLPIVVD